MSMTLRSLSENRAPLPIYSFEKERRMSVQKSKHFLVVDDDPEAADAIRFMVESFGNGIECETACDPYEALLALSDETFDLVLVDQSIPGLECTRLLHKIDDTINHDPLTSESRGILRAIPVVLMSGSDIHLNQGYKLRNFKIEGIINKSYLKKFLAARFLT